LDSTQFEKQSRELFRSLKPVEPPPYFAARVVARTHEQRQSRKQILFWRWIATFSFAAVVGLTVYMQTRQVAEPLIAFKPYVIHVDLDQSEILLAASAELELPDGVSFVAKDEEIKALRNLRLPIQPAQKGRNRLPFVIVSERTGKLPLRVRLYDENNNLIQTKTMDLMFITGEKG
jgi:hypothetical protein